MSCKEEPIGTLKLDFRFYFSLRSLSIATFLGYSHRILQSLPSAPHTEVQLHPALMTVASRQVLFHLKSCGGFSSTVAANSNKFPGKFVQLFICQSPIFT